MENTNIKPFKSPPPVKFETIDYKNWSNELNCKNIRRFAPRSNEELIRIVNWAYNNNIKVRASGEFHNWSPLLVENKQDPSNVILLDLSRHLNKCTVIKEGENGTVTAQAGITMQSLLTELEKKKLGFLATPAPGDITLGGVLAIGGHGTGIPAAGERRPDYASYGSLSNSIISLTIIAWDAASKEYRLKTLQRNEDDISAFLVNLGQTFVVDATLQVPRNRRLRCLSSMNVPAEELFSLAGGNKRTFSYYLDKYGRAEVIWFPFTNNPWLKVWEVSNSYPQGAKAVSAPFNYPFSDNIPASIADIIKKINTGHSELTPSLGKLEAEIISLGLGTTISMDLWGWSKNLLLYIKPSTLRVTDNGYAIIMERKNVQTALHDFVEFYLKKVDEYQKENLWPMNGPIEIRVTGLDHPSDSVISGAVAPALSAIRPNPLYPERDTAIWLDILTLPGTPGANRFYSEVESWLYKRFSGNDAEIRVEWSKGWAYTPQGAWLNDNIISRAIPESFKNSWQQAMNVFEKYDPHKTFTSPFTEKILR